MEFVEAPAFTRHLSDYLSEEGYRKLQARLAANPALGDVLPGTGGFRKLRWADARRGKGRRGGLRIIYYYFRSDSKIWFMTLYDKSEASDLTASQKTALKLAIERETAARAMKKGPYTPTQKIMTEERMAKRDIFGELVEGIAAMKNHREGKITLRSHRVEAAPLPKVDSKLIRDTRKKLRCSRAVFARKLRINERTLEKWEQGRSKPNPQAAALVLLVRRYPDTLARLDEVAAR
jgi:DNA-binding transcriptional regulator YiaG